MKKILLIILLFVLNFLPVFAKTDRTSAEYLKNKKHLSVMNPVAESTAQRIIAKILKKKVGGGDYKVRFSAYTLSSMRKGIFKSIEVQGTDLRVEDIPVPFIRAWSLTDYNWVDITDDPIKVKTDMAFEYYMELTEDSINSALAQKSYQEILDNLNKLAYPLFTMQEVKVRVLNNQLYIAMYFILPLSSNKNQKKFIVSTDFYVNDGKIGVSNINIVGNYKNISLEKVANLINIINPVSFTLRLLKENHCKGRVENVKIVDDIIQINGKIYIEKIKES